MSDRSFKYALGEVVLIGPAQEGYELTYKARVVAHIRYLDGAIGYRVSSRSYEVGGGVIRHDLSECEIQPVDRNG